MLSPQRIVIFQTWGIGDVVMTTPMLRAVRMVWPQANITLVARTGAAASVVDGSTLCDGTDVLAIDKLGTMGVLRFFLKQRSRKFDVALVASGISHKVAFLARHVAGIPIVAGDGQCRGRGYTHWRAIDPSRHLVENHTDILRLLVEVTETPNTAFPPADRGAEGAQKAFAELGLDSGPVLAVHPGSDRRSPQKRLPPDLCMQVLDMFLQARPEAKAAIFFGPDEMDLLPRYETPNPRILCVHGYPLPVTAAMIARCAITLSGSSGLGHISAAVGTPVLTVNGPTVVATGRPWGPNAPVIETTEAFDCQPCWGTPLQRSGCPYEVRCLTSIRAPAVFEALIDLYTQAGYP